MLRLQIAVVALAAVVFLAGCGPTVTVNNKTGFPVRVFVDASQEHEVLSPSPGESSTAEVSEGAFRVTAIPDAEWIAYARDTRKYLNDRLANSENLSGPQLLDVIQRLKDVALRMHQFETAAVGSAGCDGTVTNDSDASVLVSLGPSGALVLSCK
jgi:hypothetical protein